MSTHLIQYVPLVTTTTRPFIKSSFYVLCFEKIIINQIFNHIHIPSKRHHNRNIHPQSLQLYDLVKDPGEVRNTPLVSTWSKTFINIWHQQRNVATRRRKVTQKFQRLALQLYEGIVPPRFSVSQSTRQVGSDLTWLQINPFLFSSRLLIDKQWDVEWPDGVVPLVRHLVILYNRLISLDQLFLSNRSTSFDHLCRTRRVPTIELLFPYITSAMLVHNIRIFLLQSLSRSSLKDLYFHDFINTINILYIVGKRRTSAIMRRLRWQWYTERRMQRQRQRQGE